MLLPFFFGLVLFFFLALLGIPQGIAFLIGLALWFFIAYKN
jgi:hypothetical protein